MSEIKVRRYCLVGSLTSSSKTIWFISLSSWYRLTSMACFPVLLAPSWSRKGIFRVVMGGTVSRTRVLAVFPATFDKILKSRRVCLPALTTRTAPRFSPISWVRRSGKVGSRAVRYTALSGLAMLTPLFRPRETLYQNSFLPSLRSIGSNIQPRP